MASKEVLAVKQQQVEEIKEKISAAKSIVIIVGHSVPLKSIGDSIVLSSTPSSS